MLNEQCEDLGALDDAVYAHTPHRAPIEAKVAEASCLWTEVVVLGDLPTIRSKFGSCLARASLWKILGTFSSSSTSLHIGLEAYSRPGAAKVRYRFLIHHSKAPTQVRCGSSCHSTGGAATVLPKSFPTTPSREQTRPKDGPPHHRAH